MRYASGPESARMWRLAGLFGALGIEMAVAVAIGTWAGDAVDNTLGSAPTGVLLGFGIGLGAAVLGLRRAVVRARTLLQGPSQ